MVTTGINVKFNLACVASVPVRAKCYASCASDDSGRAKIGARAKKGKLEGEWGDEGTLAGKPHDSEKRPPISSRVSSFKD